MFGEKVENYPNSMLNEREVRAGAGILFFITFSVLLNAIHNNDMASTQLMIISFFVEFLFRTINPKYAPSLILGRWVVSNQTPEYVEAKPKRFAWNLGLGLASIMFISTTFYDLGPLNLLICWVCVLLLFLESAFGICLGCVIYKKIFKQEVNHCAGDVCAIKEKHNIQKINAKQWFVFVAFLFGVFILKESLEEGHRTGSIKVPSCGCNKNASNTTNTTIEMQKKTCSE